MLGLKMMTMVDATDGIKFDFMAPLSPKFQMGGSWAFSNTKANKFELNTALSSATGNMMNQDEMSFVSTRSDSTGKLEFSGSYNMGNNFSLKAEGFFMDEDIQKSHVSFEVMKEFSDSHLAYKIGGGSQQFSMMQALSPKLLGGFEMYYIVSFRLSYPIASHQRSPLLLRRQLHSREPSILRPIHPYRQEGDPVPRLRGKAEQAPHALLRAEGKLRRIQ